MTNNLVLHTSDITQDMTCGNSSFNIYFYVTRSGNIIKLA